MRAPRGCARTFKENTHDPHPSADWRPADPASRPGASLEDDRCGDCGWHASWCWRCFVIPVTHSATVSMTVTSPTLTPAPAIRASLSNTTDMVTEQGNREVRRRPGRCGRDHRRRGDRCRAAREHGGVGRHEWHDRQDRVLRAYPCRCRQGADAISDAYLKERRPSSSSARTRWLPP